jgi:hypothetical protein
LEDAGFSRDLKKMGVFGRNRDGDRDYGIE